MPIINNSVSVIKKWLDNNGILSKLLLDYDSISDDYNSIKKIVENLNKIDIDNILSDSSSNPVENRIITQKLKELADLISTSEIGKAFFNLILLLLYPFLIKIKQLE